MKYLRGGAAKRNKTTMKNKKNYIWSLIRYMLTLKSRVTLIFNHQNNPYS